MSGEGSRNTTSGKRFAQLAQFLQAETTAETAEPRDAMRTSGSDFVHHRAVFVRFGSRLADCQRVEQ